MSEFEYLWKRRSELRQRTLMNRIYYQERQRIFELRDGIVKVIALLAGSVAFANVATPVVIQWCAAIITISSAAALVFGFGNKARDSAKRSIEWALLERDIEFQGERDFTEVQLAQWTAKCNELEAGEPAPHPGLLERSNLRACKAMNCEVLEQPTFWQRHRPVIIIH